VPASSNLFSTTIGQSTIPLDNGYGTFKPNKPPLPQNAPTLDTPPSSSLLPWQMSTCTPFTSQLWPMCDESGNIIPQDGFTPVCSSGSTGPTCQNGQPACADSSTPMLVSNKYVSAALAKQGNNTYLANQTNYGT
jgi:hypothetical protein